jgi:hypothetical protein
MNLQSWKEGATVHGDGANRVDHINYSPSLLERNGIQRIGFVPSTSVHDTRAMNEIHNRLAAFFLSASFTPDPWHSRLLLRSSVK